MLGKFRQGVSLALAGLDEGVRVSGVNGDLVATGFFLNRIRATNDRRRKFRQARTGQR